MCWTIEVNSFFVRDVHHRVAFKQRLSVVFIFTTVTEIHGAFNTVEFGLHHSGLEHTDVTTLGRACHCRYLTIPATKQQLLLYITSKIKQSATHFIPDVYGLLKTLRLAGNIII